MEIKELVKSPEYHVANKKYTILENYPPEHDHIWQKTMDLKLERTDNCRIRNVLQKHKCSICGKEKWEVV